MTKKTQIDQLKLLAKRYARASRTPQHEALNAMAAQLGFTSWTALNTKAKNGWLPSEAELAAVEGFVGKSHLDQGDEGSFLSHRLEAPVGEPIREGKIGEHAYRVYESMGDIRMEGDGWRVLIGEADFSQPVVEIETTHSADSPANDAGFVKKALTIADEEAAKVRASIAFDWPRRSTKPDAEGNVVHPIHGDRAAEWFCLHCDGKMSGAQIAKNLWHCPGCGASPIDIFSSPWWLEEGDEIPKAVESAKDRKRPEPKIEVVDSRPTLRLDAKSITLLLRAALLEDAVTPSERLGALLAEISVDEDNGAWITLDEDLWPDFKDPDAAIAVAETLGIELELAATCMSFPFAWPDLGHVTTSTREYVQMLLDAYGEHGVVLRGSAGDNGGEAD